MRRLQRVVAAHTARHLAMCASYLGCLLSSCDNVVGYFLEYASACLRGYLSACLHTGLSMLRARLCACLGVSRTVQPGYRDIINGKLHFTAVKAMAAAIFNPLCAGTMEACYKRDLGCLPLISYNRFLWRISACTTRGVSDCRYE